jgi:hypothetical protein
MATYVVQHDYRSSRGVLDAGSTVELDEADAEWFENDSPGLLVPADEAPANECPTGSADEVLAWVGDDRERAAVALEHELAGKGRKGLTADLEALLLADQAGDEPEGEGGDGDDAAVD